MKATIHHRLHHLYEDSKILLYQKLDEIKNQITRSFTCVKKKRKKPYDITKRERP